MKTGTAIALAIGVPVTIGVIAWAVLANKVIDKVPDDFATGELPNPPGTPPNVPIPDPTPRGGR